MSSWIPVVPLTAAQLIEQLLRFDGATPVFVHDPEGGFTPVEEVIKDSEDSENDRSYHGAPSGPYIEIVFGHRRLEIVGDGERIPFRTEES